MSVQQLAAFDLDGTLVDSWLDIRLALNLTLEPYGLPTPEDADVRARIGLPAAALFAEVDEPARVSHLVKEFRGHLAEVLGTHSVTFPGAADVLALLRDRGWTCALASNKPASLSTLALERAQLREYFSVIVGPGVNARPKPDPDILLACIDVTGAKGGFMVGDSAPDIRAAQAAGLTSVLVVHGIDTPDSLFSLDPDHVVNSLRDLPAVLAGR